MTMPDRLRARGLLGLRGAALFLFVGALAAQTAPQLLWQERFGEPGRFDFVGTDVMVAAKDAVFVAGDSDNANGDSDFLVLAYDTRNGALLWQDRFDTPGTFDGAVGIATDNGRVFAMGGTNGAGGFPIIRAYDSATGLLLWHRQITDRRGVFDSAVFHRDSVIAVGGNTSWMVHSYDAATGTPLWTDRFGVGGGNRAISVAEHAGSVFVGGRARPPGGRLNWLVRAYDAVTGAVLWEDQTALGDSAQAQSIAVKGNRLIAAGRITTNLATSPFRDTDWVIRAYNARTGTLLWQERLDTGGVDSIATPFDVAMMDERVFVVGTGGPGCSFSVFALPDNCDFLVRAYAIDTGQLLWQDRVDLAPVDQGLAIAAKDGGVFAIGNGANNCSAVELTNCDMFVRAYDAGSGTILWKDQVDTQATDDWGSSIAVDRGSVFALGLVVDPDLTTDLLIRAYKAFPDKEK